MVHLRVGHHYSKFLTILAYFMGYYSELHGLLITYLGPGVISTINEP